MTSSVAVKMAKKKIEPELKVIESNEIVINNLNDVAFYWGWAEHFWKLAEHLIQEDVEKYKTTINGLRNKANDIVKEIERFKNERNES